MISTNLPKLFQFQLDPSGGTLFIHWVLLAILLVGLIVVGILLRNKWSRFSTNEIELKFGDIISCRIKPSHETVNIAYKAWIEIITRKVGLPFDEDHDVLEEVYNSWYALFGIIRELTKTIPAENIGRCKDTKALVDILTTVLNDGLRPHLTRWQARFRSWYKHASAENPKLSPQDIQKQFPEYDKLIADLKRVNTEFMAFAVDLRKLAESK
jgi:hypothetical protein